jgi:predicted ATPase
MAASAEAHPPLIGREPELTLLKRALAGVTRGGGRCVAIVGEPGAGKTRLLEELERQAAERGIRMIRGRGAEFESDIPFGVLVDALDEELEGAGPDVIERVIAGGAAELARILPALSDYGGGAPVALQVERFELHEAVRRLLERWARSKGLVVGLDDLHWADP